MFITFIAITSTEETDYYIDYLSRLTHKSLTHQVICFNIL